MTSKKDYVVGSGNVFADLKVPRPEEALAKAELAHKITTLIERRGMTQAEAAALLEKHGLDLLAVGRTGDLARWLEALPADLVPENPWLLFYRYMSRRLQGPPEVFQSLQKSLSLFDQRGDVRGVLLSLAYLIEASAWWFPGDIQALFARAEEILASPESITRRGSSLL